MLIFAPDIDIVELKNDGMNNIESNKGEIVMYQPDETIRLEVRMEGETVWLSQAQMAELFGTKRPAITKHLNNIYKCGELKEESTCSILEHMGNDGKQLYTTRYYNLDAIISVGFRVNTKRGIEFRQWANHPLIEQRCNKNGEAHYLTTENPDKFDNQALLKLRLLHQSLEVD